MDKVKWINRITNDEVLRRIGEEVKPNEDDREEINIFDGPCAAQKLFPAEEEQVAGKGGRR